jgi:hypothetical protein
MKKTLLTVAATAALVLACTPRMEAAALTVLTLDAGGGITASIDETGACTGSCANLTITVDGAHGTITAKTKKNTDFGGYVINATGVGGDDSFLPTLQNLNQIEADSLNAGGGTLTATFTDTHYPNMSPLLHVADSQTTNTQIDTSTIKFSVFTDVGNAIPAGTQIETDTQSGDSTAFSGNFANPNLTGSLTTQTVMAFTGVGAIQANITVANVIVPEPAGIVLMGTTLLAVSALIRRKQAKRT